MNEKKEKFASNDNNNYCLPSEIPCDIDFIPSIVIISVCARMAALLNITLTTKCYMIITFFYLLSFNSLRISVNISYKPSLLCLIHLAMSCAKVVRDSGTVHNTFFRDHTLLSSSNSITFYDFFHDLFKFSMTLGLVVIFKNLQNFPCFSIFFHIKVIP